MGAVMCTGVSARGSKAMKRYRVMPGFVASAVGEVGIEVETFMHMHKQAMITVKEFPPHLARGAKRAIKVLKLGMLHTNVETHHAHWRRDGSHFVATERSGDMTLCELIGRMAAKGERFTEYEVRRVICQVAHGLHHIHSNRVLHRDMRPNNVYVADYGGGLVPVIGNFTRAAVLDAKVDRVRDMDGSGSSPVRNYWSPEMVICEGAAAYGVTSDVWGLGCILYEMTTMQRVPMPGSADGDARTLAERWADETREMDYTPELRALVAAVLDENPDTRPTAGKVLGML